MSQFTILDPTRESYWRSIILFGQNVASYKFALAKSLLEVATKEKTKISIEELAVPFAANISEHLKLSYRQATSKNSKFLSACREYNKGVISQEKLIDDTVKYGFNYVLDAFHTVNRQETEVRFFEKTIKSKEIIVTDELLRLKETVQFGNLSHEVEARWRLVETAWELNIGVNSIQVDYDHDLKELFVDQYKIRRVGITSCRDALNGYQKGKCFYCFGDISVESGSELLAEVDHFFAHTLLRCSREINLNGVWNLVLACKQCNRGVEGKSAAVPDIKYLDRLHKRNNYLIESHHPLRETLMAQTGIKEEQRSNFLRDMYQFASDNLIARWTAQQEVTISF